MSTLSAGKLAPEFHSLIEPVLQETHRIGVIERLWAKDHRLWKTDPTEITNRLGWLTVQDQMRRELAALGTATASAHEMGIKDVVLLGMGGSSLGPEVLRTSFGPAKGCPRLWVLDSTVPGWVRQVSRVLDPPRTLFLVASKSGGTIEVMSLFAYFWNLVTRARMNRGGDQFMAITDPGTGLETLARGHGFRQIFINPPDIGGRYSVLSFFGLVPAALLGLDVNRLLHRAVAMAELCRMQSPIETNPGAYLGVAMGTLARSGRDKVTIIASRTLSTFGLWAEQLLAESTGKEGTGLIPVAQEPVLIPSRYGGDRFFVYLRLQNGDNVSLDRQVEALAKARHPVLRIDLRDRYDLGAEFFRWEFATAVAGHLLKIHPFDQPNVQESKDNTNRVLVSYQSTGKLPEQTGHPATQAVRELGVRIQSGSYVAILAYTTPTPQMEHAIHMFRKALIARYHITTTFGYGPRYLHSTGQLHKGGPRKGVFLELVDRMTPDQAIPGKPFTFGTLAQAQAAGDFESLRAYGCPAIRVRLGRDPVATVKALTAAVAPNRPGRRHHRRRKIAKRQPATRR
jgi:glucose-6-phosphate isomerase/transaldolase/glucose-6-phosphate isomerase